MMPVKVGDKVRIIENASGHGFDIGEIVTIARIDGPNDYKAQGEADCWYVGDNDIEIIKEEI